VASLDLYLPNGEIARGWTIIDFPQKAVGVIPVRDDGHILLVDHFRFATRTRGWEIPAGRIEPGETPEEAAVRELREESGHRAARFERLGSYHPSIGSSNQEFHLLVARGVERTGEIEDTIEVDGVSWFDPGQVREMIGRNGIIDGLSLTALLWYFFGLSNAARDTENVELNAI
jgi:8-oxo-dGTP pyrophosphatase MutT (NUDIX family)